MAASAHASEGVDEILRRRETQTRGGAVDEAVGRIVEFLRQKDNEHHPDRFRELLDEGADPTAKTVGSNPKPAAKADEPTTARTGAASAPQRNTPTTRCTGSRS